MKKKLLQALAYILLGLHATAKGQSLMKQAEQVALQLEQQSAHRLSTQEQTQLIELLQKIYR